MKLWGGFRQVKPTWNSFKKAGVDQEKCKDYCVKRGKLISHEQNGLVWVVKLKWATDQSEDSLANQRVLKLGLALDHSEVVSTHERVSRLGWAIYWPMRGRFSQWEAIQLDLLFAAHQHLPGWPPSEANERVLSPWPIRRCFNNDRVVRLGWAMSYNISMIS